MALNIKNIQKETEYKIYESVLLIASLKLIKTQRRTCHKALYNY